eukprot:791309_1
MAQLQQEQLVMKNLKEVTSITKSSSGWMPGFYTWTLKGYDGNRLVTSVSKSEANNYLKYVAFINELKRKGYKLRYQDRMHLKDEPFMWKSLIDHITRSHLEEVAQRCGYSVRVMKSVKHKVCFAKNMRSSHIKSSAPLISASL